MNWVDPGTRLDSALVRLHDVLLLCDGNPVREGKHIIHSDDAGTETARL